MRTLLTRNRIGTYAVALCLAVFASVALRHGLTTTADLDWPGHMDLYRDIAQARVFLQGNWLGDPYYREQQLWYSPLVPAMVAVAAKVTGIEVHLLYTRLGAYLNLFGIVAFFALVAASYGRHAALAATFAFLFINGLSLPFWATASYSPWLLASQFSQTLFYCCALSYSHALARDQYRWYLLSGCLMGLAFLGHSVPGLVLAIATSLVALRKLMLGGNTTRGRTVTQLLVMGVSAFVLSFPFLYSVFGSYGLGVMNPTPGSWLFLQPAEFFDAVVEISTPLAALGLLWAWRHRREYPANQMFGAICITCLALVAARYTFSQWPLAPLHHFVLYLKAIEAVYFGVGFAAVSTFLSTIVSARIGKPSSAGAFVYWAALAIFVLWIGPKYPPPQGFEEKRGAALAWQWRRDRLAAVDWIESSTNPSDIFLCDDRTALFAVGPAGRYVLAAHEVFTNPYLNWGIRDKRRRRLLGFLESGAEERFREYAARHNVTYVMLDEDRENPDHLLNRKNLTRLSSLQAVFQRGVVTIYRVVQS